MDIKGELFNALYRLIQTHKFKDITVKTILEESGVSRSSFYRYFRDKYDLMNSDYESHVNALRIEFENGNLSTESFFNEVLKYVKHYKSYYSEIVTVEGPDAFLPFLHDYTRRFYESFDSSIQNTEYGSELARINAAMVSSAHSTAVVEWLKGDCAVESEDIAALCFGVVPESLKTFRT